MLLWHPIIIATRVGCYRIDLCVKPIYCGSLWTDVETRQPPRTVGSLKGSESRRSDNVGEGGEVAWYARPVFGALGGDMEGGEEAPARSLTAY